MGRVWVRSCHRSVSLNIFRFSLNPKSGHSLPCRYVRQGDDLWWDLHAGVLSTSRLAAALGFYERGTAPRLQIPGYLASHEKLVEAWMHLMEPTWMDHQACTRQEEATALRQCKRRTEAYRRAMAESSDGQGPGAPPPGMPKDDKLRAARRLQQLGMMETASAWGVAQEGAVLMEVLTQHFPDCTLRETGMWVLRRSMLPRSWTEPSDVDELSLDWDDLPVLAASPDAIIVHPPGSSLGGRRGVASTPVTEVLEVKNLNPFFRRSTRRGKKVMGIQYTMPPRGLRTLWALQLQMHMLCTGPRERGKGARGALGGGREMLSTRWLRPRACVGRQHPAPGVLRYAPSASRASMQLGAGMSSAVLVCRSALGGSSVFRLERDDEYLRLVLAVVQDLHVNCVQQDEKPRALMYSGWAVHDRLVKATQAMAANGAELLAYTEAPRLCANRDMRWFLG